MQSAHSQHITWLQVRTTEGGNILPYAKFTNGQQSSYAQANGYFAWQTNSINSLTISAWNYADTTLFAADFADKDTSIIYVNSQPEQLNEILVNPKTSWLNAEINGFERWENGWIFLMNGHFTITDDLLNVQYRADVPKVGRRLPREIQADVSGNIFTIYRDSVQQLYFTDSAIYQFDIYPIKTYEITLKPILYINDSTEAIVYRNEAETEINITQILNKQGVMYDFNPVYHPNLHNCGAEIKVNLPASNQTIYLAIDSLRFQSANIAFQRYLAAYTAFYRKAFLSFDGIDAGLKNKYGRLYHTYKTLYAQYKAVYFLPLADGYVLLDPYSSSWVAFNHKFEQKEAKPFDFSDCTRKSFLYVDKITGKWWLQRSIRGLDQLEQINPEHAPQHMVLDGYVTNIRVYGDVVFYLNQFGKLRVKRL